MKVEVSSAVKRMYDDEPHGNEHFKEAIAFYESANHVLALHVLGVLYASGDGSVDVDPTFSVTLVELSAHMGYTRAMLDLGGI
jgi:TPR repeat protein